MGERVPGEFGRGATATKRALRALAGAAAAAGLAAAAIVAGRMLWSSGATWGGLAARASAVLAPDRCAFSAREIHSEMAVRAAVEGDPRGGVSACCLRCAITEASQIGKRVRILSVTDFNTGKRLSAAQAIYVVGANVAPCAGHPRIAALGGHQSLYCAWDRCLPSAIAFADLRQAEAFRALHGGRIESFAELASSSNVVAAR